jgi:predicted phage terminase large subunit-like protein
MFAYFASKGKWQIRPHLIMIEAAIYELMNSAKEFLIINMPPRHGKSEFLSKYFPAWYLLNNPGKRIILSTYSDRFSEQFGRIVQDIYKENMNSFSTGIYSRKQSAGEWVTDDIGGMVSVGSGGSITGRGADLFIIDDPVKNVTEALSGNHQENMKDWLYTTVLTRLEPGGKVIIIMTRWQPDDLTGAILEKTDKEKIIQLKLKAIATEKEFFRDVGKALWPERYSAEEMENIREKVTNYWFEAMYQQEPSNKGNKYIDIQNFGEYFEDAKYLYVSEKNMRIELRLLEKYATCDLAISTKAESDYTVIIIFKQDFQSNIFIENVLRLRMPPDKHEETIEQIVKEYGIKLIGIESVAYQETLIHRIANLGIPVMKLKPDKEKLIRLLRIIPHLAEGKIYIKKEAQWKKDFLTELERFPHILHDDQVDAFAYISEFLNIRHRNEVHGVSLTINRH